MTKHPPVVASNAFVTLNVFAMVVAPVMTQAGVVTVNNGLPAVSWISNFDDPFSNCNAVLIPACVPVFCCIYT